MVPLPFLRVAAMLVASIHSTIGFSVVGTGLLQSSRSCSVVDVSFDPMNSSRLRFAHHRPILGRPYPYRCSTIRLLMSKTSGRRPTKGLRMPTKTTGKKVPIILLSGFLGAGKTTTLQHLLENTEGSKIAVVVNDMAAVNIDAKLVASTQNGIMQLRNGCACCSLSDELIDSVGALIGSDRAFDAVVVEMSGVGDPIAVRSNWNAAKMRGHPVTTKADVSQVVTLIDASTFGTDWMTWDLASERKGWVSKGDDCAGERKVPELLAEQVEAADLILINKVDIAGDNVGVATSLAQELNERAKIKQVEYGRVSPQLILQELTLDSQPAQDILNPRRSVERNGQTNPKTTTNDHLGITSFVYRANRPFNMRKLMAELNQWPVPVKDVLDLELIQDAQDGGYEVEGVLTMQPSPFIGVLRSKGFCWFAPTKWIGMNADPYRYGVDFLGGRFLLCCLVGIKAESMGFIILTI